MGQFIEQVQKNNQQQEALVSEAQQRRREREEKAKEKKRQEKLKMKLHNVLSGYFCDRDIVMDEREYKNIYLKLLENNEKWGIIQNLARNEKEEYFLDINYLSILNKVKQPFMIQYKEKKKIFDQEQKERDKQTKILLDRQKKVQWEQTKRVLEQQEFKKEKQHGGFILPLLGGIELLDTFFKK